MPQILNRALVDHHAETNGFAELPYGSAMHLARLANRTINVEMFDDKSFMADLANAIRRNIQTLMAD